MKRKLSLIVVMLLSFSLFATNLAGLRIAVQAAEEEAGLEEALGVEAPAAEAPAPEPPAPEPPALPAGSVPEVQRALLVDDAKMNLLVLKVLMKNLGAFELEMAENGKEALTRLRRKDAPAFDVVLTDMWMPELDGEGLAKEIRADPQLADLPVHVITADVELQETYTQKGFDSIILKPVTIEALRTLFAERPARG